MQTATILGWLFSVKPWYHSTLRLTCRLPLLLPASQFNLRSAPVLGVDPSSVPPAFSTSYALHRLTSDTKEAARKLQSLWASYSGSADNPASSPTGSSGNRSGSSSGGSSRGDSDKDSQGERAVEGGLEVSSLDASATSRGGERGSEVQAGISTAVKEAATAVAHDASAASAAIAATVCLFLPLSSDRVPESRKTYIFLHLDRPSP